MIAYISVGVDDMERAKRFYLSFMPALEYDMEESAEGLSFVLRPQEHATFLFPEFYVKPTFNGQPATAGNGTMIAFDARRQQQVRELHAAALAAGGQDEGPPGFRERYGPNFFVAYLRDPQGNKIALFADDPSEPNRDGVSAPAA